MARYRIATVAEMQGLVELEALTAAAGRHNLIIEAFATADAAIAAATSSPRDPAPIDLMFLPIDYDHPTGSLALHGSSVPVVAVGESWLRKRVRFETPRRQVSTNWSLAAVAATQQASDGPIEEPDVDPMEITTVTPALDTDGPHDIRVGFSRSRRCLRGSGRAVHKSFDLDEPAIAALVSGLDADVVSLDGASTSVPPIVIVSGDDPLGYRALSAGADLVVLGSSETSRVGLAHAVSSRDELEEVVHRLVRREFAKVVRSDVRRLLALDLMAGTVANDAEAMARALAEFCDRMVKPQLRVSVLINNYNYGRYLGSCIASARAQTIPPHEIIVVDDGSTDNSADVIRQFEDVRCILKTNGGQASAFNAGFAASSGDVVVFVDADDRLKPNAVEIIVQKWQRGFSRLHYGMEIINADGRSVGALRLNSNTHDGIVLGPLFATGYHNFMPTTGNAFCSDALRRVLPMPEEEWQICADLYVVLETALLGRVGRIDEILAEYRVHGSNNYYNFDLFQTHSTAAKAKLHMRGWRAFEEAIRRHWPGSEGAFWRLLTLRRYLTAIIDSSTDKVAVAGGLLRFSGSVVAQFAVPIRSRSALLTGAVRSYLNRINKRRRPFSEMNGLVLPEAASDDLIGRGGRATWPIMVPDRPVDLRKRNEAERVLGSGWWYSSNGTHLEGSYGTISFTVPDHVENVYLDLDVTLSSSPTIIEIFLNGRIHDRQWLSEGRLQLHIPDAQLDRRIFGMRVCHLELVPGRTNIGLTATRLMLSRAAPSTSRRYPLARFNSVMAIRNRGEGLALLGRGFHWPSIEGAALHGRMLTVAFSAEKVEAATLELVFDRPWPATSAGADLIKDQPLGFDWSRDLASFFVSMEADYLAPHAEAAMTLQTPILPRGGMAPRLVSVRLIATRNGTRCALTPSFWHGVISAPRGLTHEGLSDNGGLGGSLEATAVVRIVPPNIADPLRVGFMFSCGEEESGAEVLVRCGGRSVRLWLGRTTIVHLPAPCAPRDEIVLHLARIAGEGVINLVSVRLEIARGRNNPIPFRLDLGAAVGGEALWQSARDTLEWHPPVEGLLWLQSPVGELEMNLSAGARQLAVSLIVPGQTPKAVTIRYAGRSASAKGMGALVVRLPLAGIPAEAPASLSVEIDGLVAIDQLEPSGGSGMLGCAIVEIALT